MESKIWCFRVQGLVELFNDVEMAGFFLQFTFPFPPSNLLSSLLKFFPMLSQPTITLTFPAPNYEYEEVWGMDNKDFYDGSARLVHVVKPLGICPGT